ncbi:MAG TPA: trehalose-phosphatase [Polyangiales bacterium]|nr:trehalose-phosphatase [Polyangiales bacterium]
MKHLLAPPQLERLSRAIERRFLVAFDFDGTLAPLANDRDAVQLRERTRELFEGVCARYACAVISGRAREDVATRLEGTRVKYVVGNHGSEPHERVEQFAAEIDDVRAPLASALAGCEGVEIEDKRYSLAIHYRAAPDRARVRSAIDAAVSAFAHRLRKIPGKLVLNLVPVQAPDKGDALQRLMASEQAEVALYVGDDITDEDVFRLDKPGNLLTARVGAAQFSAARYYLRDQQEIDSLLAQLILFRPEAR